MADLSKLSDAELLALYADKKGAPKLDAAEQAKMDPTAGMPWWEKALAGYGKAFVDMGRGGGNIITDLIPAAGKYLPTRADTDEAKKYDAPLMDTGWGIAGNVVGNVAPAVVMPASTIPRAVASGVALGALQPVGKNDSRTENSLISGMFAGAFPAAAAVVRAGKAAIEPIVAPGRTAARVVAQFADDPAALAAATRNPIELVPGSKPTLAQVAQQPGISTLERGAMNQPGPLQGGMAQRAAEQNAARMAALNSVAKDEQAVTDAIAARQQQAGPLYDAALATPVKADKDLLDLLQRPSMGKAMKRAEELAAESGQKFDPASVGGLHYMKLALDDMIDGGAVAGIGKNEQRALASTKEKLLAWMDKNAPDYAKARDTYANLSQPINEMQYGQELVRRATPALADAAGTAPDRIRPEMFAVALRDSDKAIRSATGKDLPLDKVLSPTAKDAVFGVAKDLDRASKASSMGRPQGSPTAQFLTTQNLMSQIMGPSVGGKVASTLMGTPGVGSALRFAAKYPEQRVQAELADLLLNPEKYAAAAALLNKPPGMLRRAAGPVMPYLPAGIAGLAGSGMFANGGQ